MEDSERAAIYRLHAEFCKTLADANRLLIISELHSAQPHAIIRDVASR